MPSRSLPPEIISQIIVFLPSPLAPYASVSGLWQWIIEKSTFSDLRLRSDNLPELKHILSSPRQRSCLRRLHFQAVLPGYDIPARKLMENNEDRKRNNHAFTNIICALFEFLALWEDQASISLCLESWSTGDRGRSGDHQKRRRTARVTPREDLLEWRYEWSYLELVELDGKEIPSVKTISDLKIQGGNGMERKLAPAAVSAIVAQLPHAQRVEASLFDNQKDDPSFRESMRDGKEACYP